MYKNLRELLGLATVVIVMVAAVAGRALYFTQHESDLHVMTANAAHPAQVIAHNGSSRSK